MYKITGTFLRFFVLFALFLGLSQNMLAQTSFATATDLGVLGVGSPYNSVGNNETVNGYSNSYMGANNQASNDAFYKITTGPCSDRLVVSTCSAATIIDTHLHLLDGTGVHLMSNDDSGCAASAGASEITMVVTPNTDYYIVIEGATGVEGVFDLKIQEFDDTPFTVTAPSVAVCIGNPANLTATTVNGIGTVNYAWLGVINMVAGSGSPFTIAATTVADENAYEVVATDSKGCTATNLMYLTVNALPTVAPSPDIALCATNTSVSISAIFGGSATSGTWSFTNGGGTLTNTSLNGELEEYTLGGTDLTGPFPRNVVFTVTTNAPFGCAAAMGTVTIAITGGPDLITMPTAVCAGGSVDLTTLVTDNSSPVLAGTTTWYAEQLDADTEVNAIAAPTAVVPVPVSPATTVTYWVRKNVTASGCFDIASVVVTVNPLPTITLGTIGNVCSNATAFPLPYTATTASPNQYSITAGASALPGFTSITLATLGASALSIPISGVHTPGTYDFNMTVENSTTGCVSAVVQFSITIIATPTATISYATPFCSTGTTALPVFGAGSTTTGMFGSTSGLNFNSTSTGEINIATSTPGIYTVTYTIPAGATCTTVTATTILTITALPTITAFTYPSASFCKTVGSTPSTVTGTGLFSGGGYTVAPSGLTLDAMSGAINPSTSAPGTYVVTYTTPASLVCGTVTAVATVVITALPTATISYTGSPFCKSVGTTPVNLSGTFAYMGGGYSATAGGLSLDAMTGAIDPSASTPGTYTVTYTTLASGGCTTVTATTSVTINALPTATISYTAPAFCIATAIATPPLTAPVTRTGTTGGTYSASPAGLSIAPATGLITFLTSTAGIYTVTYTFTDAVTGCTNTATTSVTMNAPPTPTITTVGGSFTTCAGTPLTLDAGVYPTYAWSVVASTQTIVANQSVGGTQNYVVTVTATNGCLASTSQVVTFIARPQASVSGTTTICAGQTATISATLTNGTTYTIVWSDGVTQTGVTSPATRTVSPLTSTTYTITSLTAVNTTCSATVADISGSAAITVTAAGAAPTVNPTSITACVGAPYTITTTPAVNIPVPVTVTYGFGGDLTGSANASGVTPVPMTSVGTLSTTSTQGGSCTAQSTDFPAGATGTSYSQAGWSVGDYHEFTLNANTNYKLAVSDFTFKIRRSNATTAPTALNVTKIVDGGTETAIGAASYALSGGTGAFQTFTLTSLGITSAVSGNVKIRVKVLTNATPNPCSTMRIDDVSFVGTTTLSPNIRYYSDAAHTAQVGTGLTYNGTATVGITNIYVRDESGACPSADAIVPITVNTPPAITANPLTAITICAGATATMTADLTAGSGSPAPTYVWTGTNTGSAAANVNAFTAAATDAGTYTVVATNLCGSSTANFTLNVNTIPTLTATTPLSACMGGDVTMTGVLGAGVLPAPTYMWTGNNVGSALANVNAITGLSPSDAGTYTVEATNICGTSTANVVLVVNQAPVITAPATLATCLGAPVTMTATLTAPVTPTPTYVWTGANVAGAVTNVNTIAAAVAGDAGTYTVSASNICGNSSRTIVLSINSLPTFTAAATTVEACLGAPATMSATFASAVSPTPTYVWTGANVASALNNVNTIAAVAVADAGSYSVVASNICGTSTATIALVVNEVPVITMPATLAVCLGTTATMTATLTAPVTPAPTYVWTGANVAGAVTNVNTIVATVAADAGTYTVVASNTCGSTTKNLVLTIDEAPMISTPATLTACLGAPVTMTATLSAAVTPMPTYVWTGNNVAGAVMNVNTIAAVVAGDAGTYTVVASNACGSSMSTIVFSIGVLPAFTATSTPITACAGSAVNMSANFASAVTPTPTYVWIGGNVAGAVANVNNIPSAVAGDAGTYTVVATSATCGTVSTQIVVNVNVAPTLTATTPVAACAGTPIVTLVSTLGTATTPAPTYVWTVPATATNGLANGNEYDIAPVTATEAGSYTVVATNLCGSATATIVLTVNALPVIASVIAPACGAGTTVNVLPTTPGTYTYTLVSVVPSTVAAAGTTNTTGNFILPSATEGTFTITDANTCTSLPENAIWGCPLPVKLTYFKGTIAAKDNQLDWGTATEQNSAWFIIEASTDGLSFKEVGRKRAAGNSSTPLTYAFTHTDVPTSMYYRLRMMDADGSFEFSNTVYLRRNKGSLAINNVFPNPTEGMITVQYEVEKPSKLQFTITDELGRRLSTKAIEAVSGVNNQPLDLADFPGGVYFLLIDEADGKRTVRRVIKN